MRSIPVARAAVPLHPLAAAVLLAGLTAPLPPASGAGPGGGLAAQEPAVRQDAGELSVERIHGTDELLADGFRGSWRSDGASWTVVEKDDRGRDELWEVRARGGERKRLISAGELVPEGASEPLSIHGHSFSPDGRYVLIFADARRVWRDRTKGKYYTFDLTDRQLRPVSRKAGWQMFAKFGPDSRRVAFVRDHDIHVTEIATGQERRLTTSGSEDTINGTTDWVYEEELGLRDAFRWSPDGTRIAYWQLDRSPIPPFHLVDETRLYPELKPVRYPKAGTENSRVRVGVLDLASRRTTWFDAGGPEYVARMGWVDAGTVAIQTLNRHQDRLELRLGDPASGRTRLALAETDSAWVDVDDDLTWIDGGRRFVWSSMRDGWNHLYLYERDGTPVRKLTDFPADVTAFHGVEEERGRVWFSAAVPGPRRRSVGWVPLDGGEPTWAVRASEAPGDGAHRPDFAPDHRLFVDTHSSLDVPPTSTLRRADGSAVRTVVENAELKARLDSLELGNAEFFEVTSADGATKLNAWRITPPAFDSTAAHPVLMYVYGGPGVQTVLDGWGGTRYLWHQLMAREGFVVVSVDNRGTGARGRDFYRQVFLRLGQLETADQLAAARQLGERPWADASRIGIWGWSYGGYMTLLTTLQGEGALVAGASVAPVTHWKLYDTIYTERYMRTPGENPRGYRKGAPLEYASKLDASLLIVHGTGDDNVHPQNTTMMVKALQDARKQFRMRIYPNKRHGITGSDARVNLFGLLTGFFQEELAGG
jgi:dipeptidyl-peptidase-4